MTLDQFSLNTNLKKTWPTLNLVLVTGRGFQAISQAVEKSCISCEALKAEDFKQKSAQQQYITKYLSSLGETLPAVFYSCDH